ncbi:MAG: hypothetical protein ACJAQ3_002354 [Planctomycetota bacterium]|jgi:hypothetical protein
MDLTPPSPTPDSAASPTPTPPSEREVPRAQEILAQAVRRVRQVEPCAFLVEPRVLRRVIKAEVHLPALSVQIPHRKTWIARRNTLIRHVELDELGTEFMTEELIELPEQAILLQRPEEGALESMGLEALLGRCWRLLFHARIDLGYQRLRDRGMLEHSQIRERIHRLGQAEFDEVCEVLRHENMVREDSSVPALYSEFAAVYGELRAFAPHCLPAYFPSLQDPGRVEALLNEDLDQDALLEATRPAGAGDAISREDRASHDETDAELDHLTGRAPKAGLTADNPSSIKLKVPAASKASPRAVKRLRRRADRLAGRGNSVAAALLSVAAARYAPDDDARALCDTAESHLRRLVDRLQAALDFDNATSARWFRSVVGLARNAGRGFWNADKRLLHDLRRVCVDHERETSKIDMGRWLRSFGRTELRRKLPNQREVLMSKHLASATRRLVSSRLTGPERDDLSHLLGEAADSAELQMRTRLRPLLHSTLREVGLVPETVPESVAFAKTVEELLDQVVRGGFLTLGHLRDALSRSHLKLEDLSSAGEFFRGDRLLKADKALPNSLDGVYQRSDFYLRWLQRGTSLVFGTPAGRFITRFVLLPFGMAYMLFAASIHVAEIFAADGSENIHWFHVHTMEIVLSMGLAALLLIHVDGFRRFMWGFIKSAYLGGKQLLLDWPLRFLKLPAVRVMLRSRIAVAFRKLVLWPMVPTAIICGLLPKLTEAMPEQSRVNWGIVFVAMSVILNSRVGRDVEEIGQQWLFTAWRRIRINLVVALFDAIMDGFKRMLELFERLLYAVDEWLRFKSGETVVALGVKAVLGLFWSVFTFVARFVVNLLVEPQVNPIKHFPVVTLSHKLLLPMAPAMIEFLTRFDAFGKEEATAVVGPTVFLIPGVIGFIAWELKSNWRLYKANRSRRLRPIVVGSHGESFIRLMKPGFHSGTLPKLFRKLRRIDRRRSAAQHSMARSRTLAKLHHVHMAVGRFVESELLSLLDELPAWSHAVSIGRVRLASNSVRVEFRCPDLGPVPMELIFEEQSGWLLACVPQAGWAMTLSGPDRALLLDALSGFYRLAGVDLIREQIDQSLGAKEMPYDVADQGLVVWPDDHYGDEAFYHLHRKGTLRPSPRSVARTYDLIPLNRGALVFSHTPIARAAWEARWASGGQEATPLLPAAARWTFDRFNGEGTKTLAAFRAS